MTYDSDMGGDTAPLLGVFQSAFSGHVSKDVSIARYIGPGEFPWIPRATINIYLYPETQEGECSVIDLLHPSEDDTSRCDNPDCRCNQVVDDTRYLRNYGVQEGEIGT